MKAIIPGPFLSDLWWRQRRFQHLSGWILQVSYHLRTSKASRLAFLLIPSALSPNATRRKHIDRTRQNLDDPRRQLAIFSIKMQTSFFFAARREAKYGTRIYFASQ